VVQGSAHDRQNLSEGKRTPAQSDDLKLKQMRSRQKSVMIERVLLDPAVAID
jgi:hypothetical protein